MKFSKNSKSIFFVALIALVIAVVVYKQKAASHERAALASSAVGVVKRQDLTQRVTISGQVWPRKRLDIRPPYSGYVLKLYVKVGDHIKEHDPIITFSPSLSSGETNFPIRAGFDGVVTQVLKAEGEYILETATDNLVVREEDLSQLTILATVPELDIAKVKKGQEALVKVSALPSATFKATIEEIALSARDKDKYSSSSTDFQIKAKLVSHDPRLLTGMSALMDVITAKSENVLVLPQEYVQETDDKVFVTLESGEKREVTTGLQTDEAVEIKSGLNEGDRVLPIDFASLPKIEE